MKRHLARRVDFWKGIRPILKHDALCSRKLCRNLIYQDHLGFGEKFNEVVEDSIDHGRVAELIVGVGQVALTKIVLNAPRHNRHERAPDKPPNECGPDTTDGSRLSVLAQRSKGIQAQKHRLTFSLLATIEV